MNEDLIPQAPPLLDSSLIDPLQIGVKRLSEVAFALLQLMNFIHPSSAQLQWVTTGYTHPENKREVLFFYIGKEGF